MNFKIGSSFDIHQRDKSRPLILGGIRISNENGLIGHSDADVLVHTITEAILGALGEEDIGKHFPDTSEKYKNIDSLKLLECAKEIMINKGYTIGNIDSQIILDQPMLLNYKPLMKDKIAKVLQIEKSLINIKATRSENSITSITKNEAIFSFTTLILKEKND